MHKPRIHTALVQSPALEKKKRKEGMEGGKKEGRKEGKMEGAGQGRRQVYFKLKQEGKSQYAQNHNFLSCADE